MAGKVPKTLKRKCDNRKQALGAVITELRLQKRLSHHDVCTKVGCCPSYMSGIEHGKQNPALEILQAVADFHKVKLSLIIARAERKTRELPEKEKLSITG